MADEQLPEGTDTIIAGAGVNGDADAGSGTDRPGFTADTGFAMGGGKASAGGNAGESKSGSTSGKGSASASDGGAASHGGSDDGTRSGAWFDKIDALKSQGYDSARAYAVTGKDRATTALDDLIRMVNDAAGQIDDKVGGNYGDYARKAAENLGTFNEGLKGKDVDELFNEARTLVAKAPAVAVGTAAALGFVIARLARAGLPEAGSASSAKGGDKA